MGQYTFLTEKIHQIIEEINSFSQNLFKPSSYIAVDEMLLFFKEKILLKTISKQNQLVLVLNFMLLLTAMHLFTIFSCTTKKETNDIIS